jgi:site-specific DNA-methyltransferase (adenine-specific)
MNKKSTRNKTIDFPIEKAGEYLKSCIKSHDFDGRTLNVTINGDFFETIEKIPSGTIDLLIVDPPYDLNKNFHGNKFKKIGYDKYFEYTESWIKAVKPKLKNTASIYVCCDWKSSISIGKIIDDNFILRNRITWSRDKGRGAKNNWKNSMEDVYYATVSDEFTFNLSAVKFLKKYLHRIKKTGCLKIGSKLKTVSLEKLVRQIFGMIFLFLTGLCPKILRTQLKNPKNSLQNLYLLVQTWATWF